MILVPVLITAAIGFACISLIWYTIIQGTGFGTQHKDESYMASQSISKLTENALREDKKIKGLAGLKQMLDEDTMLLTVDADGKNIYRYGTSEAADKALIKAADAMNGEGYISNGKRELYTHRMKASGKEYKISVFATNTGIAYDKLNIVIIVSISAIAAGIIISILLTHRFLTKFVFQKIERPIDLLAEGVRHIRDGELDYRIDYRSDDEFAPICYNFNRMAVRLSESVEMKKRHEQSRKELMAGISHDIRSPLTSIRAYVEGLIDGVAKTPESQKKYLEIIKNKAEDIDRMVRDLFEFSKMEMGENPDEPEMLMLDDMLNAFVLSEGDNYAKQGLQISCGEIVKAKVYADRHQMQRIFTNIADNSLKYKDKKVGHMTISLIDEGRSYRMSMSDDGPGVAEESLNRIFDPFYVSDPARHDPGKSNGLGLAVVAGAVERMAGRICAENAEHGGLNIIIRLPKADAIKNSATMTRDPVERAWRDL